MTTYLFIPITPEMTDYEGIRKADPNRLGIPLDKFICSCGSSLNPMTARVIAQFARRSAIRLPCVYNITSDEASIILDLRKEYMSVSLGDDFQNIINQMQRDAETDTTTYLIKGRAFFLKKMPSTKSYSFISGNNINHLIGHMPRAYSCSISAVLAVTEPEIIFQTPNILTLMRQTNQG